MARAHSSWTVLPHQPIEKLTLLIADKKAFRAHLERLADLPGLARNVSHHETIDHDPAGTLRAVAATL